jgi:hypothetical protein
VASTADAGHARFLLIGAILALLAAGCVIRSMGVLPVPLDFWADEAWWASLLETGEHTQFGFRPAGYMALCGMLLGAGGPELMLRLPSLIAGCAALLCLTGSAALSTRTRAALLFVTVLAAFHPKLVVFSKEFKPYSVEVFVFSALTLWTLLCMKRGRGQAGLVVGALAALPFCYPVLFLYPGLAIALAGERIVAMRRISARTWLYLGLVAVPALVLAHFFLFEELGAGPSRLLWGSKYDVFPIDTGLLGGLAWYLRKTWELLTLPGGLEAMPGFGRAAFAAAFAGGVAVLVSAGRWRELALFGGPIMAALTANLLGYWPYGAFRANLFLIPGMLLVAGQAVDWMGLRPRMRWGAYALTVAALVAATAAGLDAYRTKRSVHWAAAPQLTAVLSEIERRRRMDPVESTDVILADWHSWRPILYYLPRQPALRDAVRLVRGPVADLGALGVQLDAEIGHAARENRTIRLWVVVTRLDAHRGIRASAAVARYAVFEHEFDTGDSDYHPLLIELRVGPPTGLRPAAARRYHPRPRAIPAT